MSFTLSTLKIATPTQQVVADAIRVAAFAADVKLNVEIVSVTEVVKMSPFNIMPTLKTESGNFSGLQAVKALQTCGPLAGRCPYLKTQIDQYFQIVPLILEQVAAFVDLEKGKSTDNDKINALNKLMAFVKPLNETLVNNTYLLGNSVTFADIVIAVALKDVFARYMGPKKRAEIPALTRWFNTIMGQKAAMKVFGAEIAIQAKDVYLMPDLTVAAKPEPKKEDPIAKLPKSPLHLDTVKKLYCQERPFYPKFAEEFWPIFDAAGYEAFEVEFRYPEDFPLDKKLFMCQNGINGFISRGEAAKRNAFVVLNIYEKDGFFNVKGAAIVRGTREIDGEREIPFAFADVSDAEEYFFRFIDTSSDEGKAKFITLFCAENVDGKEILDRVHLK